MGEEKGKKEMRRCEEMKRDVKSCEEMRERRERWR